MVWVAMMLLSLRQESRVKRGPAIKSPDPGMINMRCIPENYTRNRLDLVAHWAKDLSA